MLNLRSVRGRSALAGLVLLVLLVSVAALATWRAQRVKDTRASADRHAAVAASLDDARARTFLLTAQIASSIFSDEAFDIVEEYSQAIVAIDNDMLAARAGLVAMGELDEVAALDAVDSQMNELMQDPDVVNLVTSLNEGDKTELGRQYYPQIWPRVDKMMADLQQLADGERGRLAVEQAAANSASDHTFGLLIGLSLLAFLGAFGVLGIFIMSMLRPLASLQKSARAVTAGNWNARAGVYGPEETASLARAFNEMTESLIEKSAQAQESEGRFRDVLEVSRDLIYKLNLQTRTYDYVSPSALRLTGFTFEELQAMGLRGTDSRVHPDDVKRYKVSPNKLPSPTSEDGPASAIEYRWKCKDGEYRWFSDNRALVRDDAGEPLATVGTVRDITERKQAEAALRESEERFRTLSASAPIGIFLADARGNAVYSNEHAVRLGGGTIDDTLGYSWNKFIHPDDRQAVMEEGAAAAAERRKFSMEYRILTKAGQVRWLHTTIVSIRSPEGTITGYVGTMEDITERRQAEEEMANRLRMESAIARASNVMAASDDVSAALDFALPMLAESFGVERAVVFVAQGRNRIDAVSAWHARGAEGLRDFDSSTLPWIAETMIRGEALIVPDLSALPPEAAAEKKTWGGLGVRSLVAVPLASGGRNIGCVMFCNASNTPAWRDEDVKLLRLLAESISSFIERQRAGEQKRQAYESIVFLLASAAEARDPYTENHLHRIRHYTEAIALELGLSPDEAQEIGLAALLHDLGKTRVPDAILTKPGPLSEQEWRVMKNHPTWGEELLPSDPWFKTAREIARWHHEHWDGGGYPDGLRQDMIPLAPAIVAVADGFDAMTSRRPYKGPWPPVRAMREISKQRGRQYSPEVVDAFQRAVDKGEIARIASTRISKLSDLTKAA
jgi:PAS domain S-box-containing protein